MIGKVTEEPVAGERSQRWKRGTKQLLRRVLPLRARLGLAHGLDRCGWLPSGRWWATQLLGDLADADPDTYHRFLWSRHMAYAETYEVARRFGVQRINRTRRLLFADLAHHLDRTRPGGRRTVRSVFEVGCSLGYLLHHLERHVFCEATTLEGVDIDVEAVRAGRRHLADLGSRVRLYPRDMAGLSRFLEGRRYDVALCCGVLMYAREEGAEEVVRQLLRHAGLVAISGLAHPDRDNAELEEPAIRRRDRTFIHNVDRLVRRAGGRVVYRRWGGASKVDGNTVYWVFAEIDRATEEPS